MTHRLRLSDNFLGRTPSRKSELLVALLILVMNSLGTVNAAAQNILAQISVPTNACCQVTVSPGSNKIYVSGGYAGSQDVFFVDGKTLAGRDVGIGSTVSVDPKTHNYWAATVYGGSAVLRSGRDNSTIANVVTGNCPVNTAFDRKLRRVWVGAQCGSGNDPMFAIDADNFSITAGPIEVGGVMGATLVNPSTGRIYLTLWHDGGSKRIDPKTLAVTTYAFGSVEAVNSARNTLYAIAGNALQIIKGKPDPEVITASVDLGYAPLYMAVNSQLGHLYISDPTSSSVEVRDSATGVVLQSFPLGAGVTPQGIATDPSRHRLYVGVSANGGDFLYVLNDSSQASGCLTAGTC